MHVTVVGTGKAGTSFSLALARVGHRVESRHHDELARLGEADLVLLCVPDDAIASVAGGVRVSERHVVAHVAGSRGIQELAGHPRRGFLHPLAALPTPEVGARRLLGARYSVGGDPLVGALVATLSGRALTLSDASRARYHAAATVAANHTVALLGHLQALAEAAGMCLEDFLPLVGQAVEDAASLGVRQALTGPAARHDLTTIDRHLAAIPDEERPTYAALARAAFELAEERRGALA